MAGKLVHVEIGAEDTDRAQVLERRFRLGGRAADVA